MDLTALSERTLDDPQLLWVDVASNDDRLAEIAAGLGIEEGTTESLAALLLGRASRISVGISASTALFLGEDRSTTNGWTSTASWAELGPRRRTTATSI